MSDRLERYTAKYGNIRITAEMKDFMQRRTTPFLDKIGTGKPLDHLLQESYMQGMSDAITCVSEGNFVVVPKEPTQEMINAGFLHFHTADEA